MRQVGKEEASGSPGVRDSAGQPTTPPFGIKRFFLPNETVVSVSLTDCCLRARLGGTFVTLREREKA